MWINHETIATDRTYNVFTFWAEEATNRNISLTILGVLFRALV